MITRFSIPLLVAVLALCSFSCGSEPDKVAADMVEVSLEDSLAQSIYDLGYTRNADSLVTYLSHSQASYRYLAATLFGSFQENIPLDSLAVLLGDPLDEVRAATAFALGQSKKEEAESHLLRAFEQYDTLGNYRLANRAILEAVGKCGSASSLNALSTISTYGPKDTFLLEGQAWGLYRFALRGMNSPEGTQRMLDLVIDPNYPKTARVIAANYLYRSRNINIYEDYYSELARALIGDEDPRIRMALAIGLGKTGSPLALEALKNAYSLDPDYRVKCNVISALANFEYDDVRDLAYEAMEDSNIMIAERGAGYFLENGNARESFNYYSLARKADRWQVYVPLYAAVLRHLPTQYKDVRNSATNRLRINLDDEETSPFEKIACLHALAEDPWNYRFIYEDAFDAEEGLVRQAAVTALGIINADPGASSIAFTRFLAAPLKEAISSGDPGMVISAAEVLSSGNRDFREVYGDIGFLEEAFEKIPAGGSPDSRAALVNALDSLKGSQTRLDLKPSHRQIDWDIIGEAGRSPTVQMRTDQGNIELELFPDAAPGTVSSFLKLIREDFYRDTYFYRVVPNFVIQGALPLSFREDDFVLSSEFSQQHYLEEGYLGMASSGPNTESTQFFITHSPTPHLDGGYTLFGKVVSGMDVVHRVVRGSRIEGTVFEAALQQ